MNFNTLDTYFVSSCSDVVLWSGGCDSTLLLYNLLEYSSIKNPIGALSINHYFLNSLKLEAEKKMREKFIQEIIIPRRLPLVYDEIDFNGLTNHEQYNAMNQPVAWITHAYNILGKDSRLYWSVLLDGGIHTQHLSDVKELVRNINNILDKQIVLETPLIHYTKLEIIDKIFQYELENYVWVCESPKKENDTVIQCGGKICNSCKHHLKNLLLLRIKYSNDKEMIHRIDNYLENNFNIKFTEYSQFDYLFNFTEIEDKNI